MGGDTSDLIVFVLVVGSRFLVPLLIPRFPLPAILAALVIDAADQSIFQMFTDLELEGYQSYDKALDIYYLTIAYVSVLRNWTNGFAVEVARFLWYYRLIGVVLFELTETRALLFIFPNTFEYFFIAYEVIRTGWDPRRLIRSKVLWMAGFIWVVIKLPQEWWIHIAQNDFTDFMKERVFGVQAEDPWGEALTNRPLVSAVLAVAMVLIAVVAVVTKRRMPPQDWSIRFDVDRPVPAVEIPAATLAQLQQSEPALRWPVLEKIALISLITFIFSTFLQIGASNIQILAATTLVVAVNAGISLWMARRDTTWSSIAREFVALAAVNAVLIAGFASIVADGRVNRGASIFFGLLLTLIITLYDRFRGMRLERHEDQQSVAA
jgi:hypothetical protein